MSKDKKEYIELLLKDRELRLDHLREEHRKVIAVFEAEERMLMKDRDLFSKELNRIKS